MSSKTTEDLQNRTDFFMVTFSRKVCRTEYGVAPDVKIDGHVHSSFPYITTPLNYIIPEMLKNAFR